MLLKLPDVYIVYIDLKGYSKLKEDQKHELLCEFIPNQFDERFQKHIEKAVVSNTWGDAVLAVFSNGAEAADFMLTYRDAFSQLSYDKLPVIPRIAGHYGEVYKFFDKILKKDNVMGKNVDTTARIEPITRPGEVFVTKEFKEALRSSVEWEGRYDFSDLGILDLAKDFGKMELFRLRGDGEEEQIVDRLFEQKINDSLPELDESSDEEEKTIKRIEDMKKKSEIEREIDKQFINIEKKSGAFLEKLAGICKSSGLYEQSLEVIFELQNRTVTIDRGVHLRPYVSKKKIITIKADCLSRLGKYEEAATLLYSLWQSIDDKNSKDAYDILSTLAAQFKRRALASRPGDVKIDLLNRAKGLYLTAFKINPQEYYPAINAAYLYRMTEELGHEQSEAIGKKLAAYIIKTWGKPGIERNWWLDASLAEAKILQGRFSEAAADFREAMGEYVNKTKMFEIESTKAQIEQYLKVVGLEEAGAEILDVLDEWIHQYEEKEYVK